MTCQIEVGAATDGTKDIQSISFFNTSEYSTLNSEMAAKNFLFYMFTSMNERYEKYTEATGGQYDTVNRDKALLESDYGMAYTTHFKNRATENCLQNMEDLGYYTLVDHCAYKAGAQVRFVNAILTDADDVNGDKDTASYLYVATLEKEKDGEIKEFTVQGSINVANYLNGWKVYDVLLSDKEALEIYITGESENYLSDMNDKS